MSTSVVSLYAFLVPRITALERARATSPRPTPLDALRLARRSWLAGERLDMGALAKELGVSRATLYSWVGSRERLIGEVIWSFAEEGLRQATEAAQGRAPTTSSTWSSASPR